jgi:hypothetical protein
VQGSAGGAARVLYASLSFSSSSSSSSSLSPLSEEEVAATAVAPRRLRCAARAPAAVSAYAGRLFG